MFTENGLLYLTYTDSMRDEHELKPTANLHCVGITQYVPGTSLQEEVKGKSCSASCFLAALSSLHMQRLPTPTPVSRWRRLGQVTRQLAWHLLMSMSACKKFELLLYKRQHGSQRNTTATERFIHSLIFAPINFRCRRNRLRQLIIAAVKAAGHS